MKRVALAAALVALAGAAVWWARRPAPVDLDVEVVREASSWRLEPPIEGDRAVRNGRVRYRNDPWGIDLVLERVAGTIRPRDGVVEVAGGVAGAPGAWRLAARPGSWEVAVRGVPLAALRAGAPDVPLAAEIRRVDLETGVDLRFEFLAVEEGALLSTAWAKTALMTGGDGRYKGGLVFDFQAGALAALLGAPREVDGRVKFEGQWQGLADSPPRAVGRFHVPVMRTPAGVVEDIIADACEIDAEGIRFDGGRATTPTGRITDLSFRLAWARPAAFHLEGRRGGEPLDRAAVLAALGFSR